MTTIFPEFIDTNGLAKLLAGGDDYIRTKNNVVKGLALTRRLNPDAPEVVAYGKGPRVIARAELFLASGFPAPTYIKRQVNRWQYLGQYRAIDIRTEPHALKWYGRTRRPNSVAGALILERVDTESVQISGGGFPDSKTRAEVEAAAVTFALAELARRKFEVEDCQRENRGFDLLATKRGTRLLVEVKGTDSASPRFFLTRNEDRVGASEPDWRLFMICMARTSPLLREYTYAELVAHFNRTPLAWECTLGERPGG